MTYQYGDGAMIARSELPGDAWPVYVRRGRIPRGGQSRTGRFGEGSDYGDYEDGISVFNGYQMRSGQVAVVADSPALLSLALGQAVDGIADGRWYVVTGVPVGTGSDGEPLLRDCRRLRTLAATRWPVIITD